MIAPGLFVSNAIGLQSLRGFSPADMALMQIAALVTK